MFQIGYVHLPKLESLRIEGGPRAADGYDPNPRPVAVSPEQLEKLRSVTAAAAPQPKRKSAGRVEKTQVITHLPEPIQERSKDMPKAIDAQPEQIRQIHERYMAGERLADCVAGQGLSAGTAVSRFKGMGLEYPRPKVEVTGLPPRFTRNAPVSSVAAAVSSAPDEQMDDPEPYAAATDSPVIAAQEMVTFPRLVTAFDDLPLQPGSTRRAYAPPAIIREGSLKPVVPEIQTMQVNALEHLPRLADFLRDLRGIEGIRIAGSVSIALSIEAEL